MFGKVFASLWHGSLFGRTNEQLVFIYMLANSDANGVVDIFQPVIAQATGLTVEAVRAAIAELEGPDPATRTPGYDGARIQLLDDHRDWGWIIVNFQKYRDLRDAEIVREKTKERVRAFRAKRDVTLGNADVTLGNGCNDKTEGRSQMAEGEDTKSKAIRRPSASCPRFEEFWNAYPKKVGRKPCLSKWVSLKLESEADSVLSGIERSKNSREWSDPNFIPHPLTFLNQERWKDEANTPAPAAADKPRVKRWTCTGCGGTFFDDKGLGDFRTCENCEAKHARR